jgi:hypothetical protein
MTTQTVNKDWELLDKIQKVALDYGVRRIEQYPIDNQIEIAYEAIGQGSILTQLIEDMLKVEAPDRSFRIKMAPSEKRLLVELL